MQKEKLKQILTNDNITTCINNNLDILLDIIPELKDILNFEHNNPHHHLNVWEHTLLALSLSPNNFEIRLALLLHDIGKPHSYQDKEIRHFKDHPKVSAEITFKILKRLNFDNQEISKIYYLVKQHDNRISTKEIFENKELAIQRFQIQICDALAHHPEKLEKRIAYLNYINKKLDNKLNIKEYQKKLTKKISNIV